MDINAIRNVLPQKNFEDFDNINNQVILGASNHIKMIGNMIESITLDSIEKNQSIDELRNRIKTITNFFIATRGEASQAITNAINLMILGLDNYDSSDDIKIVGNKIIDIKNQYAVKNKEAIDKVVEYATEALKDKNNIFIYDYSSTVEKIVSKLDKGKNIYIAESRIIDGGKPFLKASLEAGLNVHYFPDASIMYFLGKSDVALMGAETFYPDGTGFNTTGSDIVGLVCAYFDIPLYFATPLIKVDSRPLYGKKKNIVFNNVKNKLSANFSDDIDVSKIDFVSPELLGVSPKYIKAFITEKGVIPSSAMYEVSIEYLKEIGGNKI